jgi:hypothetical protein
MNEAAKIGQQITEVAQQIAPTANTIWQTVDPDSHKKYGSDVMDTLDATKAAWGGVKEIGDTLEQGKIPSKVPSGLYLPDLPFNQQQQMQELFSFNDLVNEAKKFGNQVGNVGNQMVGHITNAVPHV